MVAGEIQGAGEHIRFVPAVACAVALVGVLGKPECFTLRAGLPQGDGQALGRAERVGQVVAEYALIAAERLAQHVDRFGEQPRLADIAGEIGLRIQGIRMVASQDPPPEVKCLLVYRACGEAIAHQAQRDGQVVGGGQRPGVLRAVLVLEALVGLLITLER